jgi:hypothetical protein
MTFSFDLNRYRDAEMCLSKRPASPRPVWENHSRSAILACEGLANSVIGPIQGNAEKCLEVSFAGG